MASRTRWYLAFVVASVAGTGLVSAVYLRSALRHRAAVTRGAGDLADGLLREIADSVEAALQYGAVPLYREAREVAVLSGDPSKPGATDIGPRILGALETIRDSIVRCGCGPAVRIKGIFYWDRATHSLSGDRSRAESVRPVLERADTASAFAGTQLFGLATGPGEPPAYLRLLPIRTGRGETGAVVFDYDLDSLVAGVRRSYDQAIGRYIVDAPMAGRFNLAGLRVTHSNGTQLLAIGTGVQAVATAGWADPTLVAPGSLKITLGIGDPLLERVFPGGVPSSPWPLAIGSLALSIVLAVLALMSLRRFDRLVALREGFVSGVTHELRTPITQILLYGETLQLERPTPEARRRAAEVIVREARRLSHMIENALAFSRSRRPEVGLEPAVVDLGKATAEAAADLMPLLDQRHTRLKLDPEPDVLVSIDPGALRQIVANLLENAVLHGAPNQTVSVTVRGQAGSASLFVADQGPGIPDRERQRIWEPFYRGPGGGNGTGLGLSIVRQLVEIHGGRISVQDATGGGARFEVKLPRVHEDYVSSPAESTAPSNRVGPRAPDINAAPP